MAPIITRHYFCSCESKMDYGKGLYIIDIVDVSRVDRDKGYLGLYATRLRNLYDYQFIYQWEDSDTSYVQFTDIPWHVKIV